MTQEYCTCKKPKDPWFDRSITTDEQGNELQGMGYVCDRCHKRIKPPCLCGEEDCPFDELDE